MRDIDLYRTLLGIEPPWVVKKVTVESNKEEVIIYLDVTSGSRFSCPKCGKAGCSIKDRRERVWRHLDTCQFKTLINAPLPRVYCPDCGVKTVVPPWGETYSRFTSLFERFAIDAIREMSIVGVCRILKISWDEADTIIDRAVKRGLNRMELGQLKKIGIDEKAVKKGHKYITVVYDLDTSKVIWVGKDRKKETLDSFFASLPKEVLKGVECITVDMWKPYRASCLEWIEKAEEKIVLDKFHLSKHLNEAVNHVRKIEHRKLNYDGNELLKKSKYCWLYNSENIPEQRLESFKKLCQNDLKTVRAWHIKETFRYLWDYTYKANAKKFFDSWYFWATHSKISEIIKVAKRFKKHLPQILTYFKYRISNSKAEGINNKIQSIKKKAYGFRNINRFINAIYFHCGKLELYPL